jgi:D-sedoheptulose 7-phosphate isomerase
MQNPESYLEQTFLESEQIRRDFFEKQKSDLLRAASWVGDCIKQKGKVLICGNGGSAADAQHMAAEMVGRMLIERRPLPAIALTTDSSNITAIANDYSYDVVFQKQVEALGNANDLLIAISTSGNSKNVLAAVQAAKSQGMRVISITGGSGGLLKSNANPSIEINLNAALGKNSSRIQETHVFIFHSLVDLCDRFYLGE